MSSTPTRDRPLTSTAAWWEDLVWPRVASAPLAGLHAGPIVLAMLACVAVVLLLSAGSAVDAALLGERVLVWPWMEPTGAGGWAPLAWELVVGVPSQLVLLWPVTTLIAGPAALVVALVAMGALSRSAACAIAGRSRPSWAEALGMSIARWRSLAMAVVLPLAIVWGLALAIGVGSLLLRVPVLDVVAAAGWIVAAGAGVVAMVLILGLALGHGLLVPAVVCDGADGLDAVQRALGYAFARPARLAAYLALAWLSTAAIAAVLAVVVVGGLGFAARSAQGLGGERGTPIVWQGTLGALGVTREAPAGVPAEARPDEALAGTRALSARLIRLWGVVVVLGAAATAISAMVAGATGAYLGIRAAVDGVDMGDLHEPGRIEASMRESLAGRAAAAGVAAPAERWRAQAGDAEEA